MWSSGRSWSFHFLVISRVMLSGRHNQFWMFSVWIKLMYANEGLLCLLPPDLLFRSFFPISVIPKGKNTDYKIDSEIRSFEYALSTAWIGGFPGMAGVAASTCTKCPATPVAKPMDGSEIFLNLSPYCILITSLEFTPTPITPAPTPPPPLKKKMVASYRTNNSRRKVN